MKNRPDRSFVEITRRQIVNCFTHFAAAAAVESLCMQITYGQCYGFYAIVFSLSRSHMCTYICEIELDITQTSPATTMGRLK